VSVRRRLACVVAAIASAECGGELAPPRDAVIAKVTGYPTPDVGCPSALQVPSPNDTAGRWRVVGTDLGVAWDTGTGEVALVFGDTFENLEQTGSHRRNVLAFSVDRDPTDGITLTRMIEDAPGHAAEILHATTGLSPTEEPSVIPTAGLAIGPRQVLFYMSVSHWGPKGRWATRGSSVAFSDDGGAHWLRDEPLSGPSDGLGDVPTGSGFAQVAVVREDDLVYMFGTPAGRFGPARLARVQGRSVLDRGAYEYLAGDGSWVADVQRAQPVVPPPVGELSIRWNAASRLYRMTYLDERRAAIVLRTSERLVGPWSDASVLVDTAHPAHPKVYGGFQHPWLNDGDDAYLLVSRNARGACYDVFLTRAPTR